MTKVENNTHDKLPSKNTDKMTTSAKIPCQGGKNCPDTDMRKKFIRSCHYFNNNNGICPFEENCKFKHVESNFCPNDGRCKMKMWEYYHEKQFFYSRAGSI